MPSSRRELLATVGAAALCVTAMDLTPSPVSAADLPLIDTHQHLWDGVSLKINWLTDPGAAKIANRHNMEDYLREAKGLNIVKTIYMEVDAAEDNQVKEADFVIATCKGKKTPMRKGVVSCRPASPHFKPYAERYEASPYISGYRQILHPPDAPAGLCLQPEFVKNVRLMGDMGKSYDICVRPGELMDGYTLADLCPQTRFVLDHCGNGDVNWEGKGREFEHWKKGMTEFAKRQNVICKLSGIIRNAKPGSSKAEQLKPLAKHVIQTFGPNRVIWASDWPVCEFGASLKEWVEVAHALTSDLSSADQRRIFHDNAARFYGV